MTVASRAVVMAVMTAVKILDVEQEETVVVFRVPVQIHTYIANR